MIEEEVEEEATMEGDPTEEGVPSVEQQRIARRACIHFAEYRMFQARAKRCRETYVELMSQIGIHITPQNEGQNELIKEEQSEGAESGVSWNPEENEERANRSSEGLQATAKMAPSGRRDRHVPRSDGLVYLEDARRSMEENPEGRKRKGKVEE